MTPREVFSGAKLALLDQDGTLFLGGKALPGARDFVSALRERGISPVFLSNNTSRSLRRTLERLNALPVAGDDAQNVPLDAVFVQQIAFVFPRAFVAGGQHRLVPGKYLPLLRVVA